MLLTIKKLHIHIYSNDCELNHQRIIMHVLQVNKKLTKLFLLCYLNDSQICDMSSQFIYVCTYTHNVTFITEKPFRSATLSCLSRL